MASTSALRVAFVGAGYMALEHLRAFAACPEVELVGIHSRSTHRAEALTRTFPGLNVFPASRPFTARPR